MTVRVYRFDDASAPVLSGQVGALIALLDACLVNGYGSKSAAGWTKPYTGANLAAFRSGTGSNQMYLRVDDTAAQDARLVGYETMSDVNTGSGPFPTTGQFSGGLYMCKSNAASSTARGWVLIATEKAFYLWVNWNQTGLTVDGSPEPVLFFGDFTSRKSGDAFNTMIIASTSATTYSGNYFSSMQAQLSDSTAGHYIARAFTQTGAAIVSGKIHERSFTNAYNIGSAAGAQATVYPDPVAGGIILTPAYITEGASGNSVVRGVLPGVWGPCHSTLVGNQGDTFTGSGDLSGKTFILLDCAAASTYTRVAFETSNTW